MSTTPNDPLQLFTSLFQGGKGLFGGTDAAGAAGPGQDPMASFAALTRQMAEAQAQFMKQATDFWSGMVPAGAKSGEATGAAAEDRRFAAEAWKSDPRFDLVRRSYLAYSDFLRGAVESAPVDEPTKAQMRFGMRQFVDAMSPSNFFLTNPEAMQLAAETGGQSVVQGMNLFFDDLAKGRVSSTDDKAYEVGRDLATTPGAVVFENEMMQLIQYAPTTAQVRERPLVMIPPCINKFYILDLQAENSLVRHAVGQGHTVFMVSWRNASPAQGHWTWDDYLRDGVMQAIDVALDVTGADKANSLGFCVGGTLLASALAVQRAHDEDKVASMTLLTTMLDFSDTGEIGTLVTPESVAAREASIGGGGLMKGKELAFTFSSLRSNDLIWQYVVNSYLKGKAPPAFDMLYWNADSTNLPGPMFCWYVRNTYLENKLCVPGGTVQCGQPVDLSLIDVPVFLYASREDHIVPWQTAFASSALLAGDTTFLLGASGHIAGVINPPSKNKRNFWVNDRDAPDADQWLEAAESRPGSWWPTWTDWLGEEAGDEVPAPRSPGNRRHKPIEPAPGRYVKEKDA
ncbi:MAG TPA: class I poly(R)-hydroxyalkanoic acid synthase [Casimicrobiaceae bacterium]|nr:class I poly(R)-hydroxyalkanoic acid synthase [Casimicrobiaceae bacterium]